MEPNHELLRGEDRANYGNTVGRDYSILYRRVKAQGRVGQFLLALTTHLAESIMQGRASYGQVAVMAVEDGCSAMPEQFSIRAPGTPEAKASVGKSLAMAYRPDPGACLFALLSEVRPLHSHPVESPLLRLRSSFLASSGQERWLLEHRSQVGQ